MARDFGAAAAFVGSYSVRRGPPRPDGDQACHRIPLAEDDTDRTRNNNRRLNGAQNETSCGVQ